MLFLVNILVPLTIPEVIIYGIILTIGILGLSSAITLVIRMEGGYLGNEALRNTEYFVSNKRIFSLRNIFRGYILLINIFIIDIDYFFFEADCHLNLKITHKNEENLKNLILHCKPMKEIMIGEKCKVQIERDEGWEGWDWEWDALEKEVVYRLSNIGNFKVISKVLTDQLNIKEKEPPNLWLEKYGVMY